MITWKRVPGIIKPRYLMLVDGNENGVWIHSVQHPTANRPYTVVAGLPIGESVSVCISTLAAAKAAAIEYLNGLETT